VFIISLHKSYFHGKRQNIKCDEFTRYRNIKLRFVNFFQKNKYKKNRSLRALDLYAQISGSQDKNNDGLKLEIN